jgi:hypothetical protein
MIRIFKITKKEIDDADDESGAVIESVKTASVEFYAAECEA